MATAKPFSWVVRFTVAPLWIQDGFSLSDDRALGMLARAVGCGSPDELQAKVLEAPSALDLARMQGYGPKHSQSDKVVRTLLDGVGQTGQVMNALIKARELLDGVAFIKTEGDTCDVLDRLCEAIDLLDARQGDAVEIEA